MDLHSSASRDSAGLTDLPGTGLPGGVWGSSWLEGGWALLDAAGCLEDVNEPLARWLEDAGGGRAQPGEDFWRRLEQCHSGWVESLAAVREGKSPFQRLELDVPASATAPRHWYLLETAVAGTQKAVRLNSVLPPRGDLAEEGWDEHLRTEGARRQMFMRLLRAEAQLDKLVRHWPGVIFSQRPDFTFLFASPRIEELTGISARAWQTQPQRFWQVVHEADAAGLQHDLKRAARAGEFMTKTFRIRHVQTGRVSYILEHRQPVVSRGGLVLAYEGVWLDVTRQTVAERRLSSAAWKETLAVLTMGLAHDFSNIMAGIHSLSESYLSQVDAGHEFHEGLSLIKRNSLQASQLVHRIINLHLGRTGDRNYYDLNEIVTELLELVRKIIPRRIQVAPELAPGSLPVYVDPVEFRQTVINLTLNAADAMPQTGTLSLRTRTVLEPSTLAHAHGQLPRLPCFCLTVQDTGRGISPRYLDAIFDPFFTTKAVNKGSGLGLYNARLFVEKHQGAISVESVEGQGAAFHLWLPQADFTEAERAEARTGEGGRRQSLLLVGQAGAMLDETAEVLRTQGYQVATATSAEGAREVLASGDHACAGLLALAEPGGTELLGFLAECRREYPDMKIILKPVGCDRDDLNAELARSADLLVSADLPQPALLEKLKASLQGATP